MTDPPEVSVVIRAKDEAASIGRVLELLRAQTVAQQVIVVDSGSTDATVAIARAAGVHLIEIPASSFTYGGALNRGCAAATAPIIVALSAHAFPPDPGWLARMVEPFADARVAATIGADRGPEGEPLRERLTQDAALAERHPRFGYSNAAGAFRAELWRGRPFREDMPFTEDKEWALHWLRAGRTVVVGPDLAVHHDHSKDPALETFRRARNEWIGLGMYVDLAPHTARDAVRLWWSDRETYRSRARARLSHRRAARLLGRWAGQRESGRQAARGGRS